MKRNALNDIHNNFLAVHTDKAAGNMTIVSKRFYGSIILKELGLDNNLAIHDTYRKINTCLQLIILIKT